ncbi:PQQ-dependent sugar dehydrogenase [Cellulomonas fimi]|uniref:Glucose sorbosone dehydrogenase n=1 Tax=Cellulomonas fimi (strain ATCC 484 / DSM 20113 / JCM 1341 / CCUG 24087 / LMG 16345 / NBRC 15513 / NCIMB 8980 / NCTC 7547 / NRS-133) TaxID=590998 RepID=F4GZ76_CELFA|nr:PQQ-dependent sugar dehydrogenase [Cellulomonas fimi]AEE47192.1 glucose sorbosone dehydrogenase [Cellulomonas fimi ATCC 484]NNH08881.1 PQQ-dependent sugar dehydrogenase [Cellulomonas fimi]VEH35542.1 Quinoprotein glucose dehydrogenase B precursor [Cellulomonas fimi]
MAARTVPAPAPPARRRPTTRRSGVARALAVAAVLALAACTGGGPGSVGSPVVPAPATTDRGPSSPPGPSGPATVQVVEVTDVATGLDVPWGIAFLPDGSAAVTLRDEARVVVVGADGSVRDVGGPGAQQLTDVVAPGGEGGLLGVTVLDATADGAELALYATTAQDNRVLRGTLSGTTLGELTPVLTGIPRARNHDGGRLAVGPDGYLYVTTGDAGDRPSAQDGGSLAGKVLRVTADGAPAPGNPDPASPVWSLGHRNVQGLGWSSDGRLFAAEFGQDTWDELNVVVPGGNYGWPLVEGAGGDGFVDPVATWATSDASPSGLAVTDEAVYLAGLRGERLWRVPLLPPPGGAGPAGGVGVPQALLTGEHGRLRAVEQAPDGSLWVLTNNTDGRGDPRDGDDRVLRVVVR